MRLQTPGTSAPWFGEDEVILTAEEQQMCQEAGEYDLSSQLEGFDFDFDDDIANEILSEEAASGEDVVPDFTIGTTDGSVVAAPSPMVEEESTPAPPSLTPTVPTNVTTPGPVVADAGPVPSPTVEEEVVFNPPSVSESRFCSTHSSQGACDFTEYTKQNKILVILSKKSLSLTPDYRWRRRCSWRQQRQCGDCDNGSTWPRSVTNGRGRADAHKLRSVRTMPGRRRAVQEASAQ